MSTVPNRRHYTVEEYLALESDAPIKHEFYRGELFAMAGASIRHNEIAGNIFAHLHAMLRGKGCRPFGSDQRIAIEKSGLYTYSDTAVICGPLQRDSIDKEAATNPRVVFEVLAKSTENYDRGQKFEFYQQLATLQEYVLVSQDEAKVTKYLRADDGTWRYTLVSGLGQILVLESLNDRIAMTDIYENIKFGPEEASEILSAD
jgi:Uma2 family endonuclease